MVPIAFSISVLVGFSGILLIACGMVKTWCQRAPSDKILIAKHTWGIRLRNSTFLAIPLIALYLIALWTGTTALSVVSSEVYLALLGVLAGLLCIYLTLGYAARNEEDIFSRNMRF